MKDLFINAVYMTEHDRAIDCIVKAESIVRITKDSFSGYSIRTTEVDQDVGSKPFSITRETYLKLKKHIEVI